MIFRISKGKRGAQSRASTRLAAIESPLSFCRPRPARRRVWNDRDGSFTLLSQHFNVLTFDIWMLQSYEWFVG